MRAAPPVEFPLARAGWWAGAGSGLAGVALLAGLAWAGWQADTQGWPLSVAAPPGVAASALAGLAIWAFIWRRLASAAPAVLRWDGAHWAVVGAGGVAVELQAPTMRLDLGLALLLSTRPFGAGRGCRWLALERSAAPDRWHLLRVALHQRPRGSPVTAVPADPGGGP